MNFKKRLFSIITVIALVLTSFSPISANATYSGTQPSAVKTAVSNPTVGEAATSSNSYNLPDNIKDGAILQAWCWSFDTIAENMENIAKSGYVAVQTSPINGVYAGGNGEMTLYTEGEDRGKWYYQYQPINYEIGNYQLGDLEDFEDMCDVAHQYGVKVIVDVVFNHVTIDGIDEVAYSPDEYPDFYHNYNTKITNYYNREQVTQYDLETMPDINTQNPEVQEVFKAYLQSCIDAGADGFRYDAAKHIEYDGEYGGSFFGNVLNNSSEFQYLEVLQSKEEGVPFSNYASYGASVTASSYGHIIKGAISSSGNLSKDTIMSYDSEEVSEDNLVTWVESHDTYCNDGSYTTSEDRISLGWAVIAARAGGTPLYFSRPMNSSTSNQWGNNVIGEVGSDAYKSDIVTEVNKFRNAMVGEDEYLYDLASSTIGIERGTVGMTIVNSSSSTANLSSIAVRLADGTYKDHITGKDFTVISGKLSGSVASGSVAVLYDDETPVVSATPGSETFTEDSLEITLGAVRTTSAVYKLGSDEEVAYKDGDSITIGAGDAYDTTYTLRLTGTGEDGSTVTQIYTYTKQEQSSAITVTYYNADSWDTAWSDVKIYAFNATGSQTGEILGIWSNSPSMTKNSDGTWSYTFPEGVTSVNLVFYDGSGSGNQEPSSGGYYVTESCTIKNRTVLYTGKLIVKYVDQDGNALDSSVTSTAFYGEPYSTSAKNFSGYRLTGIPTNATGKYSKITTVTYIYEAVDNEEEATVNVIYQDKYGNILDSETMTGPVGHTYTTSAKDISGLALKETPANASGIYTKEDITVTYIYDEIDEVNLITVTYKNTNNYSTVKMYAYNENITPNYFLGVWSSAPLMTNNGDGTWSYTFALPNGATFARLIFIGSGSQDPVNSTMAGYVVTKSCYIEGGKGGGNNGITNYGTLKVDHVDEAGNKIATTETFTGLVQSAYSTSSKDIDGYMWNGKLFGEATGLYSSGTTTVTYVYDEVPEEGIVYQASPSKKEVQVGETFVITVATTAYFTDLRLVDEDGQIVSYDDVTSVITDDIKTWVFTLSMDTVGEYALKVHSLVEGGDYIESDVTAKFAVIEDEPIIQGNTITAIADGEGTVSINESTPADKYVHEYQVGDWITLKAKSEGGTFRYWRGTTNKIVSTDAEFQFIAATNEEYTAVFVTSRTVTFVNRFNNVISTVIVDEDASEIDFPDDPFSYGYTFKEWSMTPEDVLSKLDEGDVTVQALYEKLPLLYYVGVNKGKTAGEYEALTLVSVTADEPADDEKFSHWITDNGEIMSYKSTYNFYVTKAVDLEAVYVEKETEVVKPVLIQITNVVNNLGANKISFTAERSLPEGVTLVQHGIILTNDSTLDENTFCIGANGVLKGTAVTTGMNGTYVLNKGNVQEGDTWHARGYVIYKDAEGTIKTVYSEIATQTLE